MPCIFRLQLVVPQMVQTRCGWSKLDALPVCVLRHLNSPNIRRMRHGEIDGSASRSEYDGDSGTVQPREFIGSFGLTLNLTAEFVPDAVALRR